MRDRRAASELYTRRRIQRRNRRQRCRAERARSDIRERRDKHSPPRPYALLSFTKTLVDRLIRLIVPPPRRRTDNYACIYYFNNFEQSRNVKQLGNNALASGTIDEHFRYDVPNLAFVRNRVYVVKTIFDGVFVYGPTARIRDEKMFFEYRSRNAALFSRNFRPNEKNVSRRMTN